MDIASLIGMVAGFGLMIFGMVSGDQGFSALGNFFDIPSVIITIGGSICGTMASNTLPDFINGLTSIGLVLKPVSGDVGQTISSIIDLSNVARKEGLLALEEAASNLEDEFLKKGIMLVVDGTDPELVRGILETDLTCIETRHGVVIGFWTKWAELGPAWGMIGTLIGLINMLKNLSDPSSIGPNMAVALVTTFYGSVIANWLCGPTAAKLSRNNDTEIMMKEVIVEGLLSIQAGENPRVIEEKLKSFLAPKQRASLAEDSGGGGGEG